MKLSEPGESERERKKERERVREEGREGERRLHTSVRSSSAHKVE